MRVRVIKVGSIPLGLSALVDERPGSLIVWLLESAWPDLSVTQLEQDLSATYAAQGELVSAVHARLNAV